MNVRHTWLSAAFVALALILAPPAQSAPQPTGAATATRTLKIDFFKDAIKPTPAQNAAIRRAAAGDIKDFVQPGQGGYAVALADLNDDGRPDLLVRYDDMAFCGSAGCSGAIVMARAHGYARNATKLPNFGNELDVLPTRHHGMHDLHFKGYGRVWKWNGRKYD